jgi:alkanesulfonate monooxygenase SsuD/methylene tetrahydromethanopterin reductase-like flavin-dependent oxidoreductase (luciferase family)
MTKAGIYLPVGIQGEYAGRDSDYIWDRVLYLAKLAEELGFQTIRVPDHLMNCRADDDAPTLECFGVLSAVAMITTRPVLGQSVLCAAFRNPGYLMKQVTTLDVISRGRAELGLGAGWYEPEWRAYGYGFPPDREKLHILRETLEVATRMLQPERASFEGSWITIDNAVLEPKGYPGHRIPIVVGGNGQNVTWRLAAKYCDELNLSGPTVDQAREWLPIIAQRCEEVDRDPATLRVTAQMWWDRPGTMERSRVEQLEELRELGLHQLFTDFKEAADTDEPFLSWAEDCRAAGLEMDGDGTAS